VWDSNGEQVAVGVVNAAPLVSDGGFEASPDAGKSVTQLQALEDGDLLLTGIDLRRFGDNVGSFALNLGDCTVSAAESSINLRVKVASFGRSCVAAAPIDSCFLPLEGTNGNSGDLEAV
jgi:hypothetical protein